MEHRIGGLEKDSISGNISYDPDNHAKMTNLRNQKIQNIEKEFSDIPINGLDNGDILLIGWGSTNGPISEVKELLKNENIKISHIQLNCLWPLSSKLKEIITKFKSTIVIEMNDGQLYNLLRTEIAPKANSITQVSGKPFRVSYLKEKILNILKDGI